MIFQRLRETLYFFWHHLTELLWRLLPVLPLLLLANYRLLAVHGGESEKAMADGLMLMPQLLAGIAATALTIRYTLAVVKKEETGLGVLWRAALRPLAALVVVQVLAGLLILAGLLLLILPGIYLMGVLLPAYVIVVQEEQGPLAALQSAWARFRPQAWSVSVNLCALFLGLVMVLSGLEALAKLLADMPLGLQLALASALDLVGLLFSQTVGILLARFYEIEQADSRN